MTDMDAEGTKLLHNILRLGGPTFDELLKIVTPTTAKRNTQEKHTLTVSVYPLRYVIWPQEILLKTRNSTCCVSINWNFCAGDNVTAGQTVGSWMNIAQYCPQTIKYIVHPFNITTKRSIILCNNILQYYWTSMRILWVHSSRCAPWRRIGRAQVLFRSFWSWARNGSEGEESHPGRFTSDKMSNMHSAWGWLGSRGDLEQNLCLMGNQKKICSIVWPLA